MWIKRKGNNGPLPGQQAGTLEGDGYHRIQFDGKHWRTSRIAWYFMTGEDPGEMQIDHINTIRNDNRWVNLRLGTQNENQRNKSLMITNTSGVKGVRWHIRKNKFIANLRVDKKVLHLGYFLTVEEGAEAIRQFREKHHGAFTNHGT